MRQTDHNGQEAKSQQIEKVPWEMAVLLLVLCIIIKRGGVSGLPEIRRWWIREQGKKEGRWVEVGSLGLDKK